MRLTLKQIADKTGGKLCGADMTVTELVTDSRKAVKNSLFCAIKGERADGFDFIKNLDATDGIAYLTDRAPKSVNNPYILVTDVIEAIGKIASLHLDTLDVHRVAVTGSVGKTTTKNYIAAALNACIPTHFAKGNFNNELGLPLTALGTDSTHKAVVLEMGMRGLGQIEYLCNIAAPDVAVITNIGISHIELLGSRENILKAKLEITDGMKDGGTAVLNADDDMLNTVSLSKKTLWYGIENEKCDIRAVNVVDNTFTLRCEKGNYPVTLKMLGRHNIYNALAAIGAGLALGLDITKLIEGVSSFEGDGSRQNIYEFCGIRIFDDTYNASPAAMSAALSVLSNFEGRRVAVLADMLELGDSAPEAHADIANDILKNKVDTVVCIGTLMQNLYDASGNVNKYKCKDNAEALALLKEIIKSGDTVLFKGSNAMGLSKLVADFKGELQK